MPSKATKPTTVRSKPATVRSELHWQTILIGFALVTVSMTVVRIYPNAFAKLDLLAADVRVRIRPQRISHKVEIIAIDDQSIREIGQWPWPRATMAELTEALQYYKVAVIGFDIVFTERDSHDLQREAIAARLRAIGTPEEKIDSILGPSNDEQFGQAVKAQGKTIVSYYFANHVMGSAAKIESEEGFVKQPVIPLPFKYSVTKKDPEATSDVMRADAYRPAIEPLRKNAWANAFVDIETDLDGAIRREMTVVRFPTNPAQPWKENYCMPLVLAMLDAYEGGPSSFLEIAPYGVSVVRIGDITIPVDEMGRAMIDFRGPEGTMPRVSAANVLNHRLPKDALAGKIALIGVTGRGLGDRAVTPAGAEFPRVEIHANALDDALSGGFLRYSETQSIVYQRIAAIVLGIGITIAAAIFTPLYAFLAMVTLSVGYFSYAQYLLTNDALLIGIVEPLMTVVLVFTLLVAFRYVTEGAEKRYLRHAFEHYLHPDIVKNLVEDRKSLKLGGERRHLAILFADIVGFTSRAEKSDPVELVRMLNTYMTKMTDLIFENLGVVDKLMGDGIMAFWGAPNPIENPARSAVDCGLKMMDTLAQLKRDDARFNDFDIGIGVATGDAIVGNTGGENRFDYSLIGDTVNFASRLEGLTRQFKVRFLVNQATLDEANGNYITRYIGKVKVKGKELLVPTAEVIAHSNDGVDPRFYNHFAEVVEMLRQGKADVARERLGELLSDRPDDEVIGLYLEKLDDAGDQPPTEMIFEFETK